MLFQPAGAPGQVTGVTATAGQASASVSWTAPATGGPPTSYDITPYIGSAAQTPTTVTGTPPATSKTITGLTPGTAYTFKVTASNPSGSGAASAASNSVTPTGAGAPAAPTGATAEADTKSALVSWTAPSDDGGSAITGYTVTPFAGATAGTPVDVGASTTKTRVTGLTNGTAYTFKVTATNGAGTGPASGASNAVTPKASILEFTHAGHRRRRRSGLGRAGREVHGRRRRVGDRRALLQGGRQHRHARRRAVERHRAAARAGHVLRRERVGLADR